LSEAKLDEFPCDIRNDADIAEEMLAFVVAAGATSVVTRPCSRLQQSAVSP
jgi:hypothetical protein